jgi:hypothetical protein
MARLSFLLDSPLFLIGSLAVFGCQASANAQVTAKSTETTETSVEAQTATRSPDGTVQNTVSAPLPTDSDTQPATQSTEPALLGARAGLHVAQGGTANCRCLSVAVGLPDDPRLKWDGQPTAIDATGQLVVALGSNGIDCPEAANDSLGASYHGYMTAGDDVIVLVETGRLGRPLAGGAIVPKPPMGGRIIVQPVDKKSPYGRSLDGKERRCVVWTTP